MARFILSLEEEKQLVLLLAVSHLGGEATKRRVLDLIDAQGWLLLDDVDREKMESRDEERWRNDLAFIRHHLVLADCLGGLQRNRWTITAKGRQRLDSLIIAAAKGSPRKLTPACLEQLKNLSEN